MNNFNQNIADLMEDAFSDAGGWKRRFGLRCGCPECDELAYKVFEAVYNALQQQERK